METKETLKSIYTTQFGDLGDLHIREFNLNNDIDLLYSWVTKPYAKYWGMLDFTKEQVHKDYCELGLNTEHNVFIGELNGVPIFLMERYNPQKDIIANYYKVVKGDIGMHILVAPAEKKVSGFTWQVFSSVMDFLFSEKNIKRVVVEPDVENQKIHILNKKAGFTYLKEIRLPHKKARLGVCTRKDYKKSKRTSKL